MTGLLYLDKGPVPAQDWKQPIQFVLPNPFLQKKKIQWALGLNLLANDICNKDIKGAEKSTKSWVIKSKSMEDYNSITEISEQLI